MSATSHRRLDLVHHRGVALGRHFDGRFDHRDATERGLRQIARRIQNQVAAYLARPRETAAAQQ